MLSIIGVDPSLTHTVVSVRGSPVHIQTKPKDFAHKLARLEHIGSQFAHYVGSVDPGTAYVEGYGFSSQVAHSLGELGGMLQMALWRSGWEVVLVPPTTLKKFVTGKGNGEKSLVMKGVLKRWGYDAADDNDSDAYALYAFGVLHQWTLGGRMGTLPQNFDEPRKTDDECFAKVERIARKKVAA